MAATKNDLQSLITSITLSQLNYLPNTNESAFSLKNLNNFKNNLLKRPSDMSSKERQEHYTILSQILRQLNSIDQQFINDTFQGFLESQKDNIKAFQILNLDSIGKLNTAFKLQLRNLEALANEFKESPLCPVCPVCTDLVPLEHQIKNKNKIITFQTIIIVILVLCFVFFV